MIQIFFCFMLCAGHFYIHWFTIFNREMPRAWQETNLEFVLIISLDFCDLFPLAPGVVFGDVLGGAQPEVPGAVCLTRAPPWQFPSSHGNPGDLIGDAHIISMHPLLPGHA